METATASRTALILALAAALTSEAFAQNPPAAAAPQPQRGGGGRGRTIRVMTLTSPAFQDGGMIATKSSQAGAESSPQLTWSDVPDSTASFVLIVHDLDAATGREGTDDMLHWLVWNIPGTATSLPEAVPPGAQLPDGARQISVSGPYYRGPGAPASGPTHHYAFELYALDTMLDVPAVGAAPAATRAAVLAAMAGRVRGKGVMVARYRRP
ncbi:MAG: YbhB/YbcL family Raf kinase inhibitor-like protein [Gemmatimonadaceae bacterium]